MSSTTNSGYSGRRLRAGVARSYFVLCFLLSHLESIAQTNRIVCIGDSITQAEVGYKSYRYELWKMLIDSGVSFDLVGSITNNYNGISTCPDYLGNVFDRDHESRWGWRADEILASLPGWLSGYTADIALIHIGSNDMDQGNAHSTTRSEIIQIITALRADNPNITLVLCKLIPWNGKTAQIQDLNDNYITSIPAEVGTTQSPVVLVDQFASFSLSTDMQNDKIHPNASGELKIAQKFYDALRPLLVGLVDEDGDGMHDQWEIDYFGDLTHNETTNDDGDDYTDFAEYILGSNPTNALSSLNFTGSVVGTSAFRISFQTEIGRQYRVQMTGSLPENSWQDLTLVYGFGDSISIEHNGLVTNRCYRVKVDWVQ